MAAAEWLAGRVGGLAKVEKIAQKRSVILRRFIAFDLCSEINHFLIRNLCPAAAAVYGAQKYRYRDIFYSPGQSDHALSLCDSIPTIAPSPPPSPYKGSTKERPRPIEITISLSQ